MSLLPPSCDPDILATKVAARSLRAVTWLSEAIKLLSEEIRLKENDDSKMEVSDAMLITVVIFAVIEVSYSFASLEGRFAQETGGRGYQVHHSIH